MAVSPYATQVHDGMQIIGHHDEGIESDLAADGSGAGPFPRDDISTWISENLSIDDVA